MSVKFLFLLSIVTKTLSNVYISVGHYCFNIPVIIAKKNQINVQGLKNSNCIMYH